LSDATSVFTLPDDARVLVVRPDRIGDVVLSTPVFTSIRRARPGWRIAVLVRPMVAGLLKGHPDIDELLCLDTDDKPSFSNTAGLRERLAEKKFNAVIHLFSDFWISLAAWRASIPLRIGPASKSGRVFYNASISQRRSRGNRHEADYNLALLEPLGIAPVRKSSVHVPDGIRPETVAPIDKGRKNVGIFPGMGGSARNWKPEKYAGLLDSLAGDGMNVILICGPGEEELIDAVQSLAKNVAGRYVGKDLGELAAVIGALDCFVGPSTGPLHIATSVGTPAVGIYCPIRVCLPQRWGPIGDNDASFVPQVPVCERCVMEKCPYFDCMDGIEVESVFKAVKERV